MDNTFATLYDILYSLTVIDDSELVSNTLDTLNSLDILDQNEKVQLDVFNHLVEDLGGFPKPGTLVSKDSLYGSARTIQKENLEDIVKIFIRNKRNMNFSAVLTNASLDLTKPDIKYETIVNTINEALIKFSPNTVEESSVDTLSDEFFKSMTDKKENQKGVRFGIDPIDDKFRGVLPEDIVVIAGYAGSMKTTTASNLAYNMLSEGKNVLYISLEVSKEDMLYNFITRNTMNGSLQPTTREKVIELSQEDPEKFLELANNFRSLPGKLLVKDEDDLSSYSVQSFNELINKANQKFMEETGEKTWAIIVDHMQLLKFSEGKASQDPYMTVNFFTSYFRQKAAKEHYAVVLLSQTSRQGYEYACRHGGKYLMTGLAEANELERAATCLIGLFSNEQLESSKEIQIQLLKNRYGEKMLEPETTDTNLSYYMVGHGLSGIVETVAPVFDNNLDEFYSAETEELDLEALLEAS